MDIVIATDSFPPEVRGGSGRVAAELARVFLKKGHRIRVITRRWNNALPETAEENGIPIHRFSLPAGRPLLFELSAKGAVRAIFRRLLSDKIPDAVHIHQPLTGLGLIKELRERSIPGLYFFYAPWKWEFPPAPAGGERRSWAVRLHRLLRESMERTVIRASRKAVVLSYASQDILRKEYGFLPKDIVRSSGGVDLERFVPSGTPERERARLGLPADRKMLLTVRTLEPHMGVEELLEAFSHLVKGNPSLVLVVAGQGSQADTLSRKAKTLGIAEAVRFPGYVPESDLPAYYAAADLYVLPNSGLDGAGLTTAEALACGTPVVATPGGANAQILYGLDPRLLCASSSAEALFAALRNFFELPVPRAEWSLRCRAYAEAHLSWERLAGDVLSTS